MVYFSFVELLMMIPRITRATKHVDLVRPRRFIDLKVLERRPVSGSVEAQDDSD